MTSWPQFLLDRLPQLWLRTGEHVILTGVATVAAVLIGVPAGVLACRMKPLRGALLGAVGILQTVPSLAMLVILLALLNRIGTVPAIVALTLYALLPIVRNTVSGLEGVPASVLEAARGLGMTGRQQLRMVQLPLAAPVILAGIRTAAVISVGIATLSAFIGAGGLGQFINRGLALNNTRLILLGAVPAAMLALLVDFSIGAAEWGTRPTRRRDRGTWRARLKPAACALPVLVAGLGVAAYFQAPGAALTAGTVRIATKNFTEQFILGELMAQLLEANADLSVDRRFNLGGTMICHEALVRGEVDLYPEYTGTALTTVLKRKAVRDPSEAYRIVTSDYAKQFHARWLKPFGFNNTYALTVRGTNAWQTISDLAPDAGRLKAGFTAEFSERPDGYPGLKQAYGFGFGEVKDLDPAIMYEAVARGAVDVICAFATDGRIAAYHLKPLEDDRRFFPPYQAAPVVREDALRRHPAIRSTLSLLAGTLDDATMQQLNFDVDEHHRAPREVARAFLVQHGLMEE
jgi:osmoprotectant transport system substrate-binding protein/osmoprotectant transport system permease protein